MASDGIKTPRNRRAKSQRNKIVSALAGAATVAAAVESLPIGVPPGTGTAAGQVFTFLALVANLYWPK